MTSENIKRKSYRLRPIYIILPLLAVLSAVVLYVFTIKYTENFRATFSEEVQSYATEIAHQVTQIMTDRVAANLKNAETDAMALEQMGTDDVDKTIRFLKEEKERYGYTSIVIAGTDGVGITSEGELFNVSSRMHFLKALNGTSVISGLISSGYHNLDVVELAVPLKREGEVIGVLITGYNLDDFREILNVEMFGQKGSATVINSEGVIIVSSDEEASYNMFYTMQETMLIEEQGFERFKADIAGGSSGILNYDENGSERLLYYQPLGINDWYLLLEVPTDQVSAKTNLFLTGMAYIGAAIAAMMLFLMLLIVLGQKNYQKKLEYSLYVDRVTGGISFARFETEAQKKIEEKKQQYVVLQLNLKKFKLINATYGREAGNRLLKHVYLTIQEALESDEMVTRASADRFALFLRYESHEKISERLEAMCFEINAFNELRNDKYVLRFNAGACVIGEGNQTLPEYYERTNFSRIKPGEGSSDVVSLAFYDEIEKELVFREKLLENRMEDALSSGEFLAYIQPKYELKQNTIVGGEALVRWNIPGEGLISPGEFIPLFERNGFIIKLDLYMFDQVCSFIQARWDAGRHCVPISVNLSKKQLDYPDFLRKYKDVFMKYTFPAKLLEIELTESIVFDNMQQLCQIIDEIHKIGFACSMDDFGSGYSSLNMLKDIPVDILKLDRAFFYSDSADQSKSHHVIEHIISLAGKLNMQTISEGVESLDQVAYLRSVNCDMVQGFVFSKPLDIAAFSALLEEKEDEKIKE